MKLETLSAVQIGDLVNNKVVSPTEVTKYFLDRVKKRNPSINAFVYLEEEDAMKEAKLLEDRLNRGESLGKFAGVPVGLKDFLPSKKGWRNSHGGVEALVAVDDGDSMFYSAVRNAGGLAIGKTNAPPFGFSGTCDNAMYGPTCNPFDVSKNSGGSSGGSASAVADGLVPMCEGGDAGGSIRIPSSWCGCYGFKAGLGTVPSYCRPDGWAATHPYCFNGGITRSVEDSAALLNYMAQYNPRDPLSLPINCGKDFTQLMKGSLQGRKVALTYDFNLFHTSEDVKKKLTETAKLLLVMGAHVDLVNFNFHYTLEEFAKMWCFAISVDTSLDLKRWKSEGLDLVKDYSHQLTSEFIYANEMAAKMGVSDMLEFNKMRTDILDAHEDIFEKYDLILGPVASTTAVSNEENAFRYGRVSEESAISGINKLIGFSETFLVNFVGYPAASVPAGLVDGLPVGVQIIGKKYRDEDVLCASWNLEQARPWSYDKAFNRM